MPASIQRLQVGALVVVLEAQDMLIVGDHPAISIRDGVGQAAFLRTRTPVGTAPRVRVADEALAAVGHAQCPMHEELQGGVLHLLGDGADLLQVKLARQHHL